MIVNMLMIGVGTHHSLKVLAEGSLDPLYPDCVSLLSRTLPGGKRLNEVKRLDGFIALGWRFSIHLLSGVALIGQSQLLHSCAQICFEVQTCDKLAFLGLVGVGYVSQASAD